MIDADELFALIGRKEYSLLQAAKEVAALREQVAELEAKLRRLEATPCDSPG